MTAGVRGDPPPRPLPMCAHLALPPCPAYPGGAARAHLELCWSAAEAAGQAPTAAGPAGHAAAGHSPQAAGRRHTAGKALQLHPGADPQDNSAPRSGSNDFERIFLFLCLGFLVRDPGKVRCGRQGGGVTLAIHTTFPCYFSWVVASWFPKPQKNQEESRHCQVCSPG